MTGRRSGIQKEGFGVSKVFILVQFILHSIKFCVPVDSEEMPKFPHAPRCSTANFIGFGNVYRILFVNFPNAINSCAVISALHLHQHYQLPSSPLRLITFKVLQFKSLVSNLGIDISSHLVFFWSWLEPFWNIGLHQKVQNNTDLVCLIHIQGQKNKVTEFYNNYWLV